MRQQTNRKTISYLPRKLAHRYEVKKKRTQLQNIIEIMDRRDEGRQNPRQNYLRLKKENQTDTETQRVIAICIIGGMPNIEMNEKEKKISSKR